MPPTFNSIRSWLLPWWILEGDGDAYASTIATWVDENLARLRAGFEARFPSKAAAMGMDDAMAKIGRDRGIPRGRAESAQHYAARLIGWRYPRGHRVRGSAFGLLAQVAEYFGGVACRTIDCQGTTHTRSIDGDESFEYETDWTWDDRPAEELYRFWLQIDGSTFARANPAYGDPTLWGGSFGAGGFAIGQVGATFEDVTALRRLMIERAWRPAGTQPEWVILTLDRSQALEPSVFDSTFDGTFGRSVVAPDASWMHWSANVDGVQEPTRDPRCRYWSLDPAHNNTYAGDPTNFPLALRTLDGSTYVGNPSNFPTTIACYDGSTYAGNPANFPVAIQLLDDGDPSL